MTNDEILDHLGLLMDDTSTDYAGARQLWINLAYREILAARDWWFLVRRAFLTVTGATSAYDLATDALKLIRIYPVDKLSVLGFVNPKTFAEAGMCDSEVGTPTHYTIRPCITPPCISIHLYPIPESGDAGSYPYDYLKSVDDLSGVDVPEIPQDYHHVLLHGAVWKMYESEAVASDPAIMEAARLRYSSALEQMVSRGIAVSEKGGGLTV